MRRIIALGVALTGVVALALPLTQAVAQSQDAHPPLHAERLDAATLKSGALDASLAIHARRASLKKFYLAVAYTQALEAAQAAASHRSSGRSSGGGGGGGTCAGSIPGNVIYRESKCDPRAVNSRSGAAGKYQVLESTWGGYGGYQSAADAPEALQDQWAAEAYAQVGCRPWGGC